MNTTDDRKLISSLQSMRDRMMAVLPNHFGEGFDGDMDILQDAIIRLKRSPQPAKTYTFDEILDERGPEHRAKVEKRSQELLADYHSQEPVSSSQPTKPAGAVPMPRMVGMIGDRPICFQDEVARYGNAREAAAPHALQEKLRSCEKALAAAEAREAAAGGAALIDPAALLSAYVSRCIAHHDDAPRDYRIAAMREALEELGAKPAPIPQQPAAGHFIPLRKLTDEEIAASAPDGAEVNQQPTADGDEPDPLRLALADAYAHGERSAEFALEGCVSKICAAFTKPAAEPAAVNQRMTTQGFDSNANISIPRGLVAAACSAIDKKRDAPSLLAKLQQYALHAPAEPAVKATGTVDGYSWSGQTVEIILDGAVPRWMIFDKTRVTISPIGGKSDA